jgi:hypothetical protein
LLDLLKRNFKSVHHVKPPASRDESVELYLLAKDFKGRSAVDLKPFHPQSDLTTPPPLRLLEAIA